MSKNDIDFNKLPQGTVVETKWGLHLINYNSTTLRGEKKYLAVLLPVGFTNFNDLTLINANEIKEILFLGPELDSLEALEKEIPEKFLPLGSVVNTLIIEDVLFGENRRNIYSSNMMIVGHNVITQTGEIFDYMLVNIPQIVDTITLDDGKFITHYYIANHNEIVNIVYIPEELKISKCYREELIRIELEKGERVTTMSYESLNRVLDCSNNT